MRNKYEGVCYYCGLNVGRHKGHFERHKAAWRTIHAECVFDNRAKKLGATHKSNGVYYAFDNGTFALNKDGDWEQVEHPKSLSLEVLK